MPEKKPDVLFISSWYPTRVAPTLGNFVEKHIESAAPWGNVKVLHICFDTEASCRKETIVEVSEGISICRIYLKKSKVRVPVISDVWRLIRYVYAYFRGFKFLYPKGKKPDLIHANIVFPVGLIAWLLLKTKKIPFIISEHWTGYLGKGNAPRIKWIRLHRLAAKNAEFIVPVTQNLADAMKALSIGKTFRIIPNVVDVDLFRLKKASQSEVKRILHISTLDDHQKNFSGILKAIHKISQSRKDFILEIISEGDFCQFQPFIREAELQEKIKYHGLQNTAKVARIMQQCDFLLLFSNYENFPCVIAEAMSCGLPVLSTNVGGIAEHVNADNGVLITAGNIEQLTYQLEEMLDHCRGYDSGAIRHYAVENFSYEVVGRKFLELYEETLKKH